MSVAPTSSSRIPESVRRIFTESFPARDVAEPLASFDHTAAAADVRDFMNTRNFDVVGIRNEGRVVGFVRKEALEEGACGRYLQKFADVPVRNDDAPLLQVLLELNRAPFVFITMWGSVGGIVTRLDMLKPVVRMWLFGLVTMIEMRFTELIEKHCPADGWTKFLSDGRLRKSRYLLADRCKRNPSVGLLDCLQFADKGQIVARQEDIRNATVFTSRRQAEDTIKKLERLRNSLAHAQDMVTGDWEAIIRLCEFVAREFQPPPPDASRGLESSPGPKEK